VNLARPTTEKEQMSAEIHYQHFLLQNPYPRQLKNYFSGEAAPTHLFNAGKKLINFSSNDYLGLAKHPLLLARSHEYAKRWGVGAASSRLVTGNIDAYAELENQIATALGKPSALILGSGYQTNISVLEALLDADVLTQKALVFCDRYVHNSMLATTQHIARVLRFQHNDLAHLQVLLEKYADSKQPKFMLVESIYSMDGDQADLEEIIALAEQYNAFLYVDDAHAVGVYGTSGWGIASAHATKIDVIMGTFSKALGSYGGYLACSTTLRDYLINKCRGLIYSTGLSPAILGAMAGAIELLPQLDMARQELHRKAKQVREFFLALGLDCGQSSTHIIPWIVGDAEQTVLMSARLESRGILAATIRPPSVPAGKSRLRFCLSSAHTEADIHEMLEAVKACLV
jgi:8-amino-7-oxononanoate synthase